LTTCEKFILTPSSVVQSGSHIKLKVNIWVWNLRLGNFSARLFFKKTGLRPKIRNLESKHCAQHSCCIFVHCQLVCAHVQHLFSFCLTLCMLGNLCAVNCYLKINCNLHDFSSSFFAGLESNYQTVWISGQAQHIVGLDLDPNCLHRLSPGRINPLLECKYLSIHTLCKNHLQTAWIQMRRWFTRHLIRI